MSQPISVQDKATLLPARLACVFSGGKNLFPPEGANGAWSGGRWGRVGQVLTC